MGRRTSLILLAALLATGTAAADTKVVKTIHSDGYTIMGQTQPPQDSTVTTWIAADRLQTDQTGSSFIVRLDEKVVYVVDHEQRTYSAVTLPVDINSLMPPEMAAAMRQMMSLSATVTVTDQVEEIDGRSARRYDLEMSSPMMRMQAEIWATKEVPFDLSGFRQMGEEVLRMQPGMADVLPELRKIDGFQLRQSATVRMSMAGDTEMRSREQVVSVEQGEPPAGTYEPPSGYTRRELDWQSMMRSGGP